MDLLEAGLRQALFQDGSRMLESLLNDPLYQGMAPQVLPGERCCHKQGKTVGTLFGDIRLPRDYIYRVSGWHEPGAIGRKPRTH